jgi:hypothetical protein
MANEKPADKSYEVVRPIQLGIKNGKMDERKIGSTIKASELSGAGEIEQLLRQRIIADPDAPAGLESGHILLDTLTRIAENAGLLKRKGGSYELNGRKFDGLAAFRAGVSLAELESSITSAATATVAAKKPE